MFRTIITLSLVLLLPLSQTVVADAIDSSMPLEQLQSYETAGLSKKETKAHKKALKKAVKTAKREARKNAPRAPYCSRIARSRGQCN